MGPSVKSAAILKKTKRTLTVLIVLSFCLFASVSVFALDCIHPDGFLNIWVHNQSEVDNFQDVYGPCDTVTGSLFIDADGGSFTNLFGLAEIVSITDGLGIWESSVASIEGLSNLEHIGGGLSIRAQLPPSFANLTGFSSLTSLGGLSIEDTNYLYSLSGLGGLVSLESIYIFNARVLTNLQGLPQSVIENQAASSNGGATKPESLPVDLGIKHISLSSNDQLESLDGLSPTNGLLVLSISDNPVLTSISALAGSSYDDSNSFPPSQSLALIIEENPKLSSLEGVPTMPLALNELIISNNPLITDLGVLNGLLEVWTQGVNIFSNAALSDCSTLSKALDTVDDGYPGPNESTSDPTLFPPDVPMTGLYLEENAEGCNSIAEILGSSNEEGVFMDGFETKITE